MIEKKLIALVVSSVTSTATSNYIIDSLQRLGYKTILCSDVLGDQNTLTADGAVDVNAICLKLGISPKIVLFIEGGTMRVLPIGLEKLNCISAWYGIDTHMDYDKHLLISRLFDVTFIAQKEYVEKLHADGIKQVHWLPLACAPELLPMSELKRDIDISYVGSDNVNIHPHRHRLLALLKNIFPSNKFGLASPKEMGDIYSRSKIVFNKSVNNDINMRFFEAMSCGAVLVTDPIINNGLDELFEENKHYVVYYNDAELESKVKMLLSDGNILKNISQNAKQLVLEKHTYQHRTKTILDICSRSVKIASAKPTDYFSAFLALKLYGYALEQCGIAFKCSTRLGLRRYISNTVGILLTFLSKVVTALEYVVNKLLR